MVDPTNRRTFLGASGLALAGLSGCLGSSDDDESEEPTNTQHAPDGNPDRTLEWGGQGSENATQDCPDQVGYWKWVLTPGGPTALEDGAELTVNFANGTSQTVGGYFPGGGRGAVHFDVYRDGGGTVESATVTFSGGGNNPRLTISSGRCAEAEDEGPELTVVTEPAIDVNGSTGTLQGYLTDLGDYDSVDVSFEYRVAGAIAWTTTTPQPLAEPDAFSAEIAGLEPGTEYEFRAVAVAPDETTVTGEILSFTKDAEPETKPTVTTGPATDINGSTATLHGDLVTLGDYDSVDVSFEYRAVHADDWFETEAQTLTEPGPFEAEIDGLEPGTEYEYRAVAVANGTVATGETLTFLKEAEPDAEEPTVATLPATDVNGSSAMLRGELVSLGDYDAVDVSFQYRIVGAAEWAKTDAQTLTDLGPFSQEIGGLTTGTEYEFRAIAVADDAVVAGVIQRFTKEEPDEPDEKERKKEDAKTKKST